MKKLKITVLAAAFGIDKTDQDPFTGKRGIYCWRDVLPGGDTEKAIAFVEKELRMKFDAKDLHVTCMYSMSSLTKPSELKLDKQDVQARIVGLDAWKGHDDKWYVVLAMDCYELAEKHAQLKEAGAVPTFPTYKPHMTLAEGVDPAVLSKERIEAVGKALGSFNYTCMLGPEQVSDIKNFEKKVDTVKPRAVSTAAMLTLDRLSVINYIRAAFISFAVCHYDYQPSAAQRKLYEASIKGSLTFLKAIGVDKEAYDACVAAFGEEDFYDELTPFWDLGAEVRANAAKIKTSLGLSPFETQMLERSYRYCTASDEVPATINKYILDKHSLLAEPQITKLFAHAKAAAEEASGEAQPTAKALAPVQKRIETLVDELTGQKYYTDFITFNEAAAIRAGSDEAKKEKLAEYVKHTKELKAAYLQALHALVANSGKNLLDVDGVRAAMAKQGIPVRDIPNEYEGKVDALGALYTSDGKKLKTHPNSPDVKMNPNYTGDDTKAYCYGAFKDAIKASTQKIAWTSYQTVEQTAMRSKNTSDKVQHAIENLVPMRNSWRALMKTTGRRKLIGCVMEFLYLLAPRIGTADTVNSKGKSYGVTTFLVKHVSVQGNFIKIVFPAKAGGTGRYQLELKPREPFTKLLVAEMLELMEDRNPEEIFWKLPDSPAINAAADINVGFLKKYGLSAKVFRSLKGTLMATELLAKLPASLKKPPAQGKLDDKSYAKAYAVYTKNVTEFFMDCMVEVGEALSHFKTNKDGSEEVQGSTAIGSYVDQQVTRKFFADRKMEIPSTILKKLGTD